LKKLLVFIGLLTYCYLAQSQETTTNVDFDAVTQKLDKANNLLQKKITKLQQKIEKKLQKKFPDLDSQQLDSLIEARTSAVLPDSVRAVISKFCSACQEIETIKQDLKERIDVTPPNLDIAKDLNVSIDELDELKAMVQELQLPDLDQLKSFDLESLDLKKMALDKLPFSEKDLMALKEQAGSIKALLDDYKSVFDGWEEKVLERLSSLEEVQLLKEQQERIASYKPLPDGYRDRLEGMQTNDFVADQLEAKAAEYEQLGKETLQEKLDEAIAEMTKAKKKYPSLESLKDAPKRPENPLKDEPLGKRLKFGGDLQVNRESPTSVDVSVQIGYLFNPKAQLGFGVSYRIPTGDKFSSVDFSESLFSTRFFFNHFVYKRFYLQAVYESNRITILDQNDISIGQEWVQSGMIGLGKEFPISKKVNMSTSILYNFLYNDKSPYQKPWVFRVGFNL